MSVLDNIVRQQAEGKAIPYQPWLGSGEPMSTYSPGTQTPREDARLTQREAPKHLDAFGGQQAIDWVYSCANLYAENASAAEWHLERDETMLVRKHTDKTPPDAKLAPQDLVELLDDPNPYQDYSELIELLVIDLLLVGNAYWYKYKMGADGKALAIYRLSPSDVKIIPSPQGPKAYEYQPRGVKDKLLINPAQIVHIRRPNPHSNYYGLGVIKGGGRPFDLELALTDTQASYFENKADPSVIVQSERRVPRDVFNKLRAQLRSRMSGSGRNGELLVLEAGLKASSLSRSAQESMFDSLSTMSRDRICAMFRVSPLLFGLLDETAGGIKPADVQQAFDNKVMRPFLDKLQKRITRGLTEPWGVDFKIDYAYAMPHEDLLNLSGSFAKLPGVKVKEVRALLRPLGLEESTGDPTIDETVLNMPGQNMDANGNILGPGQPIADPNLPGEAGRPPLAPNTRPFPRAGQPVPAGAAVRRPAGKALSVDEISAALNRLKVEGKAAPRITGEVRPDDTLARARETDVDAIASNVEAELIDVVMALGRELLDHVEGKAFSASNLVSRIKRSPAWKTFSDRVEGILSRSAASAVSTASVHQGGAEGLDYEAIAKSVVHRPDGLRAIVANFRDDLVAKVKSLRDSGSDREALNAAIQAEVHAWREGHAKTVALTEAVEAYNEGTLSVAEAQGDTHVFVTDGDEHDQPCIDADGQTWTIGEARQRRSEHPRCRRAFIRLVPSTP